jgi:peroxiredoxin family protein
MPMPVLVQMLPGMESMATLMMKDKLKKKGVASLDELRSLCLCVSRRPISDSSCCWN